MLQILVVVVFLALMRPALAYDLNHDAECDSYPDVPINITPVFDEPIYDFSVDIPTIQTLASDPRHTVHEGHKGLTLGLTRYQPVLEFKTPISGVKYSNGLACAHVDHVDVTIGYHQVTVYIPREVPKDSCGFNEVMAHEQKHIAVNRAILREYQPIITQQLKDYLRLNGVFREQNPEYALSLLNEKLNAILKSLAENMYNENRRRQHLVDSPEEYHRISVSCNGQLARIATQYIYGRH